MAYELTWVDDPYGDRRTEMEAVIPAAFQPTTTEEVQMLPRIQHRAKEAVGGYLAIPNALMEALIHEMDAQEMFEENESAREKLEAQSGTLTVAELNEILSRLSGHQAQGTSCPSCRLLMRSMNGSQPTRFRPATVTSLQPKLC